MRLRIFTKTTEKVGQKKLNYSDCKLYAVHTEQVSSCPQNRSVETAFIFESVQLSFEAATQL